MKKPKEPSDYIKYMRAVAKEIINIKIGHNDKLSTLDKRFYRIMRKYGIKEGTATANDKGKFVGRSVANYEWTMCKELYHSRIHSNITLSAFFNPLPKDLEQY
jgi:ribosomal protein L44E